MNFHFSFEQKQRLEYWFQTQIEIKDKKIQITSGFFSFFHFPTTNNGRRYVILQKNYPVQVMNVNTDRAIGFG